jgi:pimeloyl-ACP methyl ester carboxylesterase
VPFITLAHSPLAPDTSPVRIHYRDAGAGPAIVFLHSGWGYELYPFDRQLDPLSHDHRVLIPDRSGYGKSTPIDALPRDFHARAMEETRRVLDALELNRPVLWGHSDGAIIALLLASSAPARVSGVIVEATHLYKKKPRSRPFFDAAIGNPESLGPISSALLERDHGADWPRIIERHSRAWCEIADQAQAATEDFYGGQLCAIDVPVLMIHGARDPRTEPGEIDALRQSVMIAEQRRHRGNVVRVLPDGGHSPHSERSTADEVTRIAQTFLSGIASR